MHKVCIVGCGNIGARHAKLLQTKGEIDLCFYSRRIESARSFNKKFAGVGYYQDFDLALADSEVKAFILCSPPGVHADQAISALTHGKSVLIEKPMVLSMQEFEKVQASAEGKTGNFVMVAENYFYKPSLKKIKDILSKGAIGDVESIYVKKMFMQASSGWKESYGALFEGGIHFVSLISALMDYEMPVEIKASFPGKEKPERVSRLVLNYKSGAEVTLDYGWNTPDMFKGVFQHSRMVGTQGLLTFESNGLYTKSPMGISVGPLKDLGGFETMMDDFIARLSNPSRVPGYGLPQAKIDLDIVFQAYSQAGLTVQV